MVAQWFWNVRRKEKMVLRNTQPTSEDLAKSSIQEVAGVKSKRAKEQWGPVLA